jgi:peptidoglycan/LPS O-acetylase OafA/YrhL
VAVVEVKRAIFLFPLEFTSTMLGYAALLVLFLYSPVGEGRLGRLFASAPFRLIGAIGFYSYTIYLWHTLLAVKPIELLALRGIMAHSPVRWPLFTLAYLVLAICTGAIMGILVDNPMLALRDRLFPARANALVTPSVSEERE